MNNPTEKRKIYQARYRKSAKCKAAQKRYAQSAKGKAAQARYAQSAKGKAAQRRYERSEKGQAKFRRHKESEKYRATNARYLQSPAYQSVKKKSNDHYYELKHSRPVPPMTVEQRKKFERYYHALIGQVITLPVGEPVTVLRFDPRNSRRHVIVHSRLTGQVSVSALRLRRMMRKKETEDISNE